MVEHAREIFNVVIAAIGVAVSSVCGGWGSVLALLLTLIIIDYITGLIKGGYRRELSSFTGWVGLLKKGVVFLVIILAHQVDIVLGNASPIFRTATAYFYIANEAISITENIALLGIPLPSFLIKALKAFKTNVNEMIPEVKPNEKN